ncbi:MAG: protein phosphatase 2C domain-containing protein [Microcoleaceae cyanobacterium]
MSLEKLFQISSASPPPLYCPNSTCSQPRNQLGQTVCQKCQTTLVYRYLWAVGSVAQSINSGQLVGNRYYVSSPQVWLDTKPAISPLLPDRITDEILPYLYLYPQRLHIPEAYGVYSLSGGKETTDILLLDNVPLNDKAELLPALVEAWPRAKAVRQIYWLWQILQLWLPLSEQGAAYSLLVKDNLRVEGGRIRLLQLHLGRVQPTLRDLAGSWLPFIETATEKVRPSLQQIQQLMQQPEEAWEHISQQLNILLLQQAAGQPLQSATWGATDPGPMRSHNEDNCYPTVQDLERAEVYPNDRLINHLSIVCDGVGGHEGGEVASQLAVKSIQPLIHSYITEVIHQEEMIEPELVISQLQEITRVANNVIEAENNEQDRASRQRMGTTLVMALQLPQTVKPNPDSANPVNAHELYIVNVGDSRAYWITPQACQCLTIDDDVAVREVRLGRCLYWDARQRRDAGALIQALGTRGSQYLRPAVQRFIIEEDGLLLLCSDGLSDHDWVEKSWAEITPAILTGEKSLEAAVKEWIQLANLKNGHDNTSVVLSYFGVSTQQLVLLQTETESRLDKPIESEPTEASRALMEEDSPTPPVKSALLQKRGFQVLLAIGIIGLILAAVIFGIQQGNQSPPPSNPTEDTI